MMAHQLAAAGSTSRRISARPDRRARRLLDPRAGRRAQVQLELAAVDRREEILSDPRQQHERDDARGAETTPANSRDARGSARACRGTPRAAATNAVVERVLHAGRRNPRCASRRRAPADAPSAGTSPSSAPASARGRTRRASRRRPPPPAARTDTARRRVRKNIGTNTMQMHSVETKAGTAIWSRAVEDRLLERLALLEIAVDVLDRDRRVVDQDADRQRQAAQRHDVDRLAERAAAR